MQKTAGHGAIFRDLPCVRLAWVGSRGSRWASSVVSPVGTISSAAVAPARDLFVLLRHLREAVLPQAFCPGAMPLGRGLGLILAQLLGILRRHVRPLEERRGASRAGLCSATAGLAGPAPLSVYTLTGVRSWPDPLRDAHSGSGAADFAVTHNPLIQGCGRV